MSCGSGTGSTELINSYETPLELGELVYRTVLGHAAERSLRAFLEPVRERVLTEIRRAESEVHRCGARHTWVAAVRCVVTETRIIATAFGRKRAGG
jgi:hypothetical protein